MDTANAAPGAVLRNNAPLNRDTARSYVRRAVPHDCDHRRSPRCSGTRQGAPRCVHRHANRARVCGYVCMWVVVAVCNCAILRTPARHIALRGGCVHHRAQLRATLCNCPQRSATAQRVAHALRALRCWRTQRLLSRATSVQVLLCGSAGGHRERDGARGGVAGAWLKRAGYCNAHKPTVR